MQVPPQALGTGTDERPHTVGLHLPWDERLQAVAWVVSINREMLGTYAKEVRGDIKRCPSQAPRGCVQLGTVWNSCWWQWWQHGDTHGSHTGHRVGGEDLSHTQPLREARPPSPGEESLTQVAGTTG